MASSDPPWQLFVFTPGSGDHRTVKLCKQLAHSLICVLPSVRQVEMKGMAAFALVLTTVRLCHPCRKVESVLICQNVLANFEPGCSTMAIFMRNVGEINSTVLQNENLASITHLTSDKAGITKIAKNAFGSFPNLQHLNLDGNMLSQISPTWFRNPVVLRDLRLAGNLIEGLNGSMLNGLTNLTTLSLKKNRIQIIHPNSFGSQSLLTSLDLSENQLMWVSQQIFRSLSSLRFIRLDKNPWNCSCDAEDFITSIKELKRQNQLNESMGVTCESPPLLKGQPVWNVSVCPPTQTPSETPTASPAKPVSASPLNPSSKTETSFQSRTTDLPPTASSHPATISSSESSARTKPPDASTPSSTGTNCTDLRPTNTSDTKVCTLIVVTVVLSVLLFVSCFMSGLQIRKRSNKTVMPECPKEEEEKEEGRSSPDRDAGCSQIRYSEVAWRKSFCGIRAKSANAVILASPFCLPKKDEVNIQTETEAPSDSSGTKKLVTERGAEILLDNFTTTDSMSEFDKQEDSNGDLYENPECVYVNTETVPYLSIGTVQNKPSADESTAGLGESQQRGKVIRRSSTWPPSAAQWQARCKMKEEQEADSFAVWTQNVTLKLSDEVETIINKMEHPTISNQHEKEEKAQMNLRRTVFNTNRSSVNELKKEEGKILDQVPLKQTSMEISHSTELKCGENPAHKRSSKADVRKEPKPSVTSRQRAETRAIGSKAPSGGTSPDDETLLSGNEYVFMNLLHEVAQNNGRWTRERWKQMHINKQRR